MRAVVDTNVLVSAFLKPMGNPARILRLVLQGDLEIVVSAPILAEYEEVLARPKFGLSADDVGKVLGVIRSRGVRAKALAEPLKLPDRNDEMFLEAALSSGANALNTGNKRHYPRNSCKGQRVRSPREFLDELSAELDVES